MIENMPIAKITIDNIDYDCLVMGYLDIFGGSYALMFPEYYAKQGIAKLLIFKFETDESGAITSINMIDDDAENAVVMREFDKVFDHFRFREMAREYLALKCPKEDDNNGGEN